MIERGHHISLHDKIENFDFQDIVALYKLRYAHKSPHDQKADILLYGLIIAAIDNLTEDIPVSIHRLAEITFSEVGDIQEHLPVILEVYPSLGTYLVYEQTFTKN